MVPPKFTSFPSTTPSAHSTYESSFSLSTDATPATEYLLRVDTHISAIATSLESLILVAFVLYRPASWTLRESEPSNLILNNMSIAQTKEKLDSPMFEMRPITGKGQGLVACENIARGTRIMAETPLFVSHGMSPEALEPRLAAKIKALSKDEQRQFVSLHNNFPGKFPFSGIMRTNALPCGAGAAIGGIYTTACRINHSCLPNCHGSWNEAKGQETIHAIRDIQIGEELTICYSGKGVPSRLRQEQLKKAFGFDCQCEICSLPAVELAASDIRHEKMKHLDGEIGNSYHMMCKPEASLADCYALLQLFEIEYGGYVGADICRLYYDAFQVSIAHSDQARAAEFARRAYQARVEVQGEDSPETQRMKGLMEYPSRYANFARCSKRWSTRVQSTPRGLDTAAFDAWLWARKQQR